MGLFSFLFSRHKILRTTHEAETFRAVFRENEELFLKVTKSSELKRYRELEAYVNDPSFKKRKKEIEQLTYKESEYYKAEKQYKALLRLHKLNSYLMIADSEELKGYERVKKSEEYRQFQKLKVIVSAVDFDKKLQPTEYKAYHEIIRQPKIAALIKLENMRRFKEYCEVKDTDLPQEFNKLTAFIQSEDFKNNRKFLLNKHRFQTTDDYKLWCEFESLKKNPDIVKYNALLNDPYFCSMQKWELVFEDDFNQGNLDTTKWITKYYAGERFLNDTYGVGGDIQLFTPDNISFGNSTISLNFRKESIIGKYWDQKLGIREKKYEYTSAMISTAASLRQRYGRFEAKIRLSRSAATSCFWMLGETVLPHVEIMKGQSDGVHLGMAYSRQSAVKKDIQPVQDLDLRDEYYIFTLEWTDERMTWMINDLVVKEERENIPDIPMYIVFSLGSNVVPSDKHLPVRMDIDWVKAYRLKDKSSIQ